MWKHTEAEALLYRQMRPALSVAGKSIILEVFGLATTILVGFPRQICGLAALRFRVSGTLFQSSYRLSEKVT